jgi:hypothetical protein
MPYKDIHQQRERSRLAMRVLRAKQKGLTAAEITRLTTDGLTKPKRVNSVNERGLTTKTKATNSQFLNSQIFTNFLTEIRNSQQTFLTQIENLICVELDKFIQKNSQQQSAPKSKTSTTFQTKSASSPGKVKVDVTSLVQATGLQVD